MSLYRHRVALTVTVVLGGLTAWTAADVGWWPLLVLVGAGAGLCAVVVVVMGVSGASAVHHSQQVAQAIERVHGPRALKAGPVRKEITR